LSNYIKITKMVETSKTMNPPQLGIAAVSGITFKGVGENADEEKSNCTIPDVIKSVCINCGKPQDEAYSPYCSFYCMSNHQMQTIL